MEGSLRGVLCALQAWQCPTLPRLKTKYHRRWGVSRPSSEWDRVQAPRNSHQAGKGHNFSKKLDLDTVVVIGSSPAVWRQTTPQVSQGRPAAAAYAAPTRRTARKRDASVRETISQRLGAEKMDID